MTKRLKEEKIRKGMTINDLTGTIVNLCIKIHSKVGPGCFENVYEEILSYELSKLGLKAERQILLPIDYEELYIKNAYKLDMLVDDRLILEFKTLSPLPPVCFKQIKTYLSLLDLKHGMLINFKVERMKEGIHRVFNNFGRESISV